MLKQISALQRENLKIQSDSRMKEGKEKEEIGTDI